MEFKLEHSSICVSDLARCVRFYEEAFQLKELRRKAGADRDIVFLGGEAAPHQIEVICLHGHEGGFDLGENPTHVAFRASDFAAAHELHERMGCIHHELPEFGVYFVEDPDGYLCEVMPVRSAPAGGAS